MKGDDLNESRMDNKSSILILFPLLIIVFLISLISILYLKFIKRKRLVKNIYNYGNFHYLSSYYNRLNYISN